jgi:hypothetical protein
MTGTVLFFFFLGAITSTLLWVVMLVVIRWVPGQSGTEPEATDTTLVVCVTDGLPLVKGHMDLWKKQGIPIIIGDDASSDGLSDWLTKHHDDVKVVRLEDSPAGKKAILAATLDAVETDLALLTDVDCLPESEEWAQVATGALIDQKAQALIMYAPFTRTRGWLNRLARFENVATAIQYFTWWVLGRPYMAVGRNVLYHRKAFEQFKDHIDPSLPSGDDDLFLQHIKGKMKIGATLDPRTFVYSAAPSTWLGWLRQKSRHISTSYRYPFLTQAVLMMFSLSQVLYSVGVVLTLALEPIFGVFFIIVRLVMWSGLGRPVFSRLQQTPLLPYILLLDIFYGWYLLILWPFSFLRSTKSW